jgi:hypothetical protein
MIRDFVLFSFKNTPLLSSFILSILTKSEENNTSLKCMLWYIRFTSCCISLEQNVQGQAKNIYLVNLRCASLLVSRSLVHDFALIISSLYPLLQQSVVYYTILRIHDFWASYHAPVKTWAKCKFCINYEGRKRWAWRDVRDRDRNTENRLKPH